MTDWRGKERAARRAIEDRGFIVHDANLIFRENCPNIDMVVFAQAAAIYVQVKSSTNPAGRNCVIVDGSAWTEAQLFEGAPIYNKHDSFRASFVLLVDQTKSGQMNFFLVPPNDLERLARKRGQEIAAKPKRDGTQRSIAFRKELPREELSPWLNAWHLLGSPLTNAHYLG